jgi:hypothetical protein
MHIFPIFSLSIIPPYLSIVPASRLMQAYLLYDTRMIMCNWLAIKRQSIMAKDSSFFWDVEFFKGIFSRGFFSDLSFCWFSTLFPFYKMLFMKRLELTCFSFCSDKYSFLLNFLNFSSVFWDILKGRGLLHVTGTCKHLCYIIWKGYLPPFVQL